jgi:hypothetical protein
LRTVDRAAHRSEAKRGYTTGENCSTHRAA